jgi:Phage integrase, N-terminal SAM-like domain
MWPLPGSSVGEADGIGRHSQESQRYRYQVWWRLDDGIQGSKTFDSRTLARDFKNEFLAQAAANAWVDPRRGRILFDDWADHWWRLWSSSPRRSPKGMETTESHLRCHLRPYFGRRQLRQITPSMVLRWQHELEGKLSHSGVMAWPLDPAAHPGGGPQGTPARHKSGP